ncbi:hypothetical protein TYRP_014038 [Tyrophagus putrescentiae]|nr:hypothetical protein TYRP_014038 [Tyrophagus putrescentiae]
MIQFEVPTTFLYDLATPKRCRPISRYLHRSSPLKHSLPHHRTGKPNNLSKLFEGALTKAAAEQTTVKVDGNTLIVEGKHEEQLEDGTYEFREYKSRCTVPENVLLEKIKCKIDEHGQLQIEAPLKPKEEELKPTSRTIPIEFVNQANPVKALDVKEITLD